jgi:hypothetical protein
MPFSTPTVDQFKGQFQRDFPFAQPGFGAAGVPVLGVGGAVASIGVGNVGQGYTSAPGVVLTPQAGDNTGAGATAICTVAAGQITAFQVISPGANYILPPVVSFTGGSGDDTNLERVTDDDINGALLDASFNTNPGLFANQQQYSRAFLYLTAHQLVSKMLMAVEGLGSQYEWLTKSKQVGDVHQAFEVPTQLLEDTPWLADISKTRYGAMYLQIVGPLLIGNVHVAPTFTNP